MLSEQGSSLETDNLQFGFTALLIETIEYYNYQNGTDCYLLLLDASKAFDRVEEHFNTMRDGNLCPMYYLVELFDIQCTTVRARLVKMSGILCTNIR